MVRGRERLISLSFRLSWSVDKFQTSMRSGNGHRVLLCHIRAEHELSTSGALRMTLSAFVSAPMGTGPLSILTAEEGTTQTEDARATR